MVDVKQGGVNSKLDQQWASPDTGRKNFIVQRPGLNSSVRKLLLPVDKCIANRWGGKQSNFFFATRLCVLLPKEYQVGAKRKKQHNS